MGDGSQASRAIGLMLLANFLFACVDTSTKWLLAGGLTALQLAMMRYAVHLGITLVAVQGVSLRSLFATRRLITLGAFRSFCLVSSTVVNFFALAHLSLAVSSAMLFVYPIIVCVLAAIFLGERIRLAHLGAVLLGFVGVLLIVQPFGGETNWYAVLMLYPATGMALYSVLTRKLAGEMRPLAMQLQTGILGTLVLLPMGLSDWAMPSNVLETVLLLGIGAFAWAGHEALTRAHAYSGASVLAPFGYSFVVYLTLAGWLIFGDLPNTMSLIGTVVIISAGLMIWRLGQQPADQ